MAWKFLLFVLLTFLGCCFSKHFKLIEQLSLGDRFDVVKLHRANVEKIHSAVFVVEPRNLDKLDNILQDISSPFSANYGKHMSREEIHKLTGNPAGQQAIVAYLESIPGVIIEKTSPLGNYIFAKAPVRVWEQIFNTEFSSYSINSFKSPVIRSEHLHLPLSLVPHVHTVLNTVQLPLPFHRKKKHTKVVHSFDKSTVETSLQRKLSSTHQKNAQINPNDAASGGLIYPNYVTPGFIAKYYNISDTIASFSVSQAVYETIEQSMSPADLTFFQQSLGLLEQPVTRNFGGHVINNCTADACGEASLDIQYLMGVAQQVNTTYYYTNDWMYGFITSVADLADPSDVYSISYGGPETGISVSYRTLFNTEALKLAAMGVTIVASSGDEGAPGSFASINPKLYCGYEAQFPASSPYVTAVGATIGPQANQPEVVCEASTTTMALITSGGGFSNFFPRPIWQETYVSNYLSSVSGTAYEPYVTTMDHTYASYSEYSDYLSVKGFFNASNRAYPDVAMLGHNYLVAINQSFEVFDGTSASAPVFAALVSLTNFRLVQEGKSKLGFVNPFLYAYQSAFAHDITSGNNKCLEMSYNKFGQPTVSCCNEGFFAMPGWDPTTGIGSIDFKQFLSTALSVAASSTTPTQLPTEAPSFIPSTTPSLVPSALPSSTTVPSVSPTVIVEPTLTPSVSPSAMPTSHPVSESNAPTINPTVTVTPSVSLSVSPSMMTSVSPSAMPTSHPASESNAPTINPTVTVTPSVSLSVSPSMMTSVSPTVSPSVAPTQAPISFSVSQVVNHINVSTFDSSANYTLAFAAAVAACMNGTTASNIVNIQVTASSPNYLFFFSASSSTTEAILVTYDVFCPQTTPLSGVTAADLETQLTTSVSSGAFNSHLHVFAASYFAWGLLESTSVTAEITSATPSAPPSTHRDTLSPGAIAGIVIAFVAVGVLCVAGVFWFVLRSDASDNLSVQNSDKSGAVFTLQSPIAAGSSVATAEQGKAKPPLGRSTEFDCL